MKNRKLRALLPILLIGTMGIASCQGGKDNDSSSTSTDSVDTSLPSSDSSFSSDSSSSSSSGGGDVSGETLSVADQTEVSDLNIYFTSTNPALEDLDWAWAWSDEGDYSYAFPVPDDSTTPPASIPEIGEDVVFRSVHLTFNQNYEAWSQWDMNEYNHTTMNVTGPTFFDGIIFRNEDGSVQHNDITIDTEMIKADDNGNYNIYIDIDKLQCYYNAADFPVSPVKTAVYGEGYDVTGKTIGWIDLGGTKMNEVFPYFKEDTIRIRPYRLNSVTGSKQYEDNTFKITIDYDACQVESDTAARIYLTHGLDLTYRYEVWVHDPKTGELAYASDIDFHTYYNSSAFDSKYYTDEKLGAYVEDGKTIFKLWSPTANQATLNIYTPDRTSFRSHLPTKKGGSNNRGVYTWVMDGDLTGTYYTFDVNNAGSLSREVPDPYGLSSDTNGEHSMVVNFDEIEKPAGYENYQDWAPDYANHSGVTIMEMHTRDFSADESWNGTEANRGKFNGLHERGTALADGTATGFDYVRELADAGLSHVQIMPAYDFSSVDETKLDDPEYQNLAASGIFNWGYDPQQYNTPEGSYSTDPDDGFSRVEEFMSFVNDYNNAGVGVVMDVVYNHMPSQSGSSFEQVFPGYYFRDVSVSGAGVDVAAQRSMVRQFIVDSVTMWAKEYHISGFRFDLMGILDVKTMKAVRQALDEINPNILVYGEGWQMFNDGTDPSTGLGTADMAYQGSLNYMGEDWVGSFNDDVRDAIKGQQSGDASWVTKDLGYVQQAILGTQNLGDMQYDKSKIYYGQTGTLGYHIDGRPIYNQSAHDGIGASICYTECHDNLMLWDKLTMSTPEANRGEVEDMARMANSTVLSALSPAFFQIGQDFGRSKSYTDTKYNQVNPGYFEDPYVPGIYYSHNSYNLSDEINAIDWNLLDEHAAMESDFRQMLTQRVDASEGIATSLGRELTFNDFGANGAEGVEGIYTCNVEPNDYVISIKLALPDGKTYLAIQNYSTVAVTIDNHTVNSRSSGIFIY